MLILSQKKVTLRQAQDSRGRQTPSSAPFNIKSVGSHPDYIGARPDTTLQHRQILLDLEISNGSAVAIPFDTFVLNQFVENVVA